MRLSPAQRRLILATIQELGDGDIDVRLFGSRLDENRRGGDLDLLLITSRHLSRMTLAVLKQALETRLFLPVDLVPYEVGSEPTPFQAIALKQALPIETEDAA
ncbi:nucleotidyltransferase domain-containing protein [Halomonas sp.]|jgi:predicted nucleotidyltransferase|uniref:nucleotidyltransferase domain-containing protein n=1 Tax=Halomonas sp. TaxID=1486246 RepID=UPI00356135B0